MIRKQNKTIKVNLKTMKFKNSIFPKNVRAFLMVISFQSFHLSSKIVQKPANQINDQQVRNFYQIIFIYAIKQWLTKNI